MKNLLTNRTLSAFEKWYYETHCKSSIKFEDLLLWQKAEVFDWLYSQCATIQYAFAVEFFDSLGELKDGITIQSILKKAIKHYERVMVWNDIQAYAVKKANDIFNNKTSHL